MPSLSRVSTTPILSPIKAPDCHETRPDLVHSLKHGSTVLALAVSQQHSTVFAGTQDGEIVAWSLAAFHQIQKVQAHKRSVLSLFLSPDGNLLFSSAGDPIVSVWCPRTLQRLYEIYGTHDVGDVFCTAYSQQHDTLYIGAQNATIQWVTLGDQSTKVGPESRTHPDRRSHRFFDSKAVGGASTPRRNEDKWSLIPKAHTVLEIMPHAVRNFAHNGYVFCMLMAKGPTVEVDSDQDVLISGSGDGTIKLWGLGNGIEEIMTLGNDDADSVLSLAIDGSFLYAGKLDGIVELWDLDTTQKLRVLKAHESDVMTVQVEWGHLWTASANGFASKFSIAHYGQYKQATAANMDQKYQCLSRWKAHQGKILASVVKTHKKNGFFITGANDDCVSVWAIADKTTEETEAEESEDILLATLRDFVSYKTVSSRPEFAEDCRMGATFLGALYKRLGAYVELLSTDRTHNPVVFARFSGKNQSTRKRILFYGHYDVVAADGKRGKWSSDPFSVQGTNGFLYGRGVSDNKGPIIAALYAVTDLMQAGKLDNDVIFLIEGEEEVGSSGFEEAVRRNKKLIGDVDYILLANSYWLDDEVPCLTYGLRGVLHATVSVESSRPDMHSGVDGSYIQDEPLSDLTSIISKLKGPRNKIQIPGFYDGIPAMTSEEQARYDDIVSSMMRNNTSSKSNLKQSLIARWREPNLTIHRFKVSGPDGSLISSKASSHISFRLVPGQEINTVIPAMTSFIQEQFDSLESENRLSITVNHTAEPWLGDTSNDLFHRLEEAIKEAWTGSFCESANGKPKGPLFIREGGSIPAIRFLEKEFQAPAAHLPCGKASDAAHLDNERMSVLNLFKAREIFGKVFERL